MCVALIFLQSSTFKSYVRMNIQVVQIHAKINFYGGQEKIVEFELRS